MGKRSIEKERHWREIMARYERRGMKVRAFCDREQIKEHQFFTWRRELRRRDVARTANQGECQPGGRKCSAGPPAAPHATTAQAAAFTPLHVVATSPTAPSSIEIIVADGRRVAVAPGFDPEALAQVLAVIEGRTC